jgi:tetratricopeptide (TPR) repeat protein
MGSVPAREATKIQKAAVLKALELDELLPEAHHALATLKAWGEWDWPAAERAFERAIELNPNYADARNVYSHFLHDMKRPDEAMAQIERALELDPFNAFYQAFYGGNLMFVHRYDEAIEQFRKALTTSPDFPFARKRLAEAFHLNGMYEEALEAQRSYLATMDDHEEEQEALARGYSEAGYVGAMRRLAETAAARSQRTATGANYVAALYLRAGENDLALEWLERSFDAGDPEMAHLGVQPLNDAVRNDPRFQDLLRRMNLPE